MIDDGRNASFALLESLGPDNRRVLDILDSPLVAGMDADASSYSALKCPNCQVEHPYKEIDLNKNDFDESIHRVEHCFSHGALVVFASLPCPVCLEDSVGPPAARLPCGHCVCIDCLEGLGGRSGRQERVRRNNIVLGLVDILRFCDGYDDKDIVIDGGAHNRNSNSNNARATTKPRKRHYQRKAAWALCDIIRETGEFHQLIFDSGTISEFVRLLGGPDVRLGRVVSGAIRYIAHNSVRYRDLILKGGVIRALLNKLQQRFENQPLDELEDAVGTLSILCGGSPLPDFAMVRPVIPALGKLVPSSNDNNKEVIKEAIYVLERLSRIACKVPERLQTFIDDEIICEAFVDLLVSHHKSDYVQVAVLNILFHLTTGNKTQIQGLINSGALPQIQKLLSTKKESDIRKIGCNTIRNILVEGNEEHIQAVIDSGLILVLVQMLQHDVYRCILKEAVEAICHVAIRGDVTTMEALVATDTIQPLCGILNASAVENDDEVTNLVLMGLGSFLRYGSKTKIDGRNNRVAATLIAGGGKETFLTLQRHSNSNISDRSTLLLKEYLEDGDDQAEEEEEPVPRRSKRLRRS